MTIIGRSHHIPGWQCMCVTSFYRKWCVSSPSATLLSSTDIRCGSISFFIAPCSFNWLSLKMLFLQLVSNDSDFPVYKRAKASSPVIDPSCRNPPSSCPLPTWTSWMEGSSCWGHTESPPMGMFVFGSQVARLLESVPSDSKENGQKSSS